MDPVIFLEKVRRPDQYGLVRPRLHHRLAGLPEERGSASLGLVLAPPGSGKTTFLTHLAAQSAVPVAWYRAGPEDDDELALTRHLGHALGSALGRPDLVAAAAAGRVTELVSALQGPGVGAAVLTIDDLHEVGGTAAERALERFLALRPRSVRVVMGSRRPPQLNTSRLLVSGELQQVNGEDLRFRSWEVEQLFRTVYDQPLTPESAAALTRRTGGWAAGLQLFHLSVSGLGRLARERAVQELGGRSRLIRSYLARNLLDGMADERRAFLLRTCTLGLLTADSCDALLGRHDSAAVLAELEREQFFTTSTDGGLTFHYHQVLQTHLEVLLVDELGGDAARTLYSRSAALLEVAGRPAAAVRAHARAEDWGAVGRLLKPDSPPVTGDEAIWGVLSLPGTPTDDPGLVLAGARRLVRHGLIAEAVEAYRRAEGLLDDPDFRRRCARERSAAAIWLPHAVTPNRLVSPALQLSADLRRSTREVRDPESIGSDLVRGLAHLLTGDVPAAARVLRTAVGGSGIGGWEPLALRLATELTELLGQPDAVAAGRLEEIVLDADVDGWPWLSRLARGLQAALLLAFAPAPWRRSACAELLEDLDRHGDGWTFCLTALAVGWAAGANGAAGVNGYRELAEPALRRAERMAADLDAPVLQAWATLLRLELVPEPENDLDDRAAVRRWAAGLGLRVMARAAVRTSVGPDSTEAGSRLDTLGHFALSLGGVEMPWRSLRPRARTLLMLLAVHHRRWVHRELLVDTLWPDATLSAGIRSLQVAVSAVRQCLTAGGLTENCLRRHGDAYALELPGAADQRATFERLAHQAEDQERAGRIRDAWLSRLAALEQYAGELLPEVGPAEWVVEERARLRTLAATVAAEAAQGALALRELSAGVRAARRSVELDPFRDSTWGLLVELSERGGDPSAAAVARREYARVRADLGVVEPA